MSLTATNRAMRYPSEIIGVSVAYKRGYKFCICPSTSYTVFTGNLSTNRNYKTEIRRNQCM